MSIGGIGGKAVNAYGGIQESQKEITTITTHCNKKHQHDKSCPHTVTTQPAPKVGETGHFFDRKV